MAQWGNTPLTRLRCAPRLLSIGRPVLPGHNASSIRIATPRIPARHFRTINTPLLERRLNRNPKRARPQPSRKPLPSSSRSRPPQSRPQPSQKHLPPSWRSRPAPERAATTKRQAVAAGGEEQQQPVRRGKRMWWSYPQKGRIIPLGQVHSDFPRPQEPHLYRTTMAPTDGQLEQARRFFARGEARFVFACESFRKFPAGSPAPEVAVLGRSNVGKSSLLNALFGRHFRGSPDNADPLTAKVSNRAGKTRTMNVFLVGKGAEGGVKVPRTDMHGKRIKGADGVRWIGPGRAVAVVDMPGHGFGSKHEWGEEITKYLTKRPQLRRVFVLIDSEHGVKKSDVQVLDLLGRNGVPHQVVLSKADKILYPTLPRHTSGTLQKGLAALKMMLDKVQRELLVREREQKGTPALGEILAVSAKNEIVDRNGKPISDKIGINGLRWAILQAANLEQTLE